MVGIVKEMLKKAKQSQTDPQLALMCLRSTPIDAATPSPAELLYSRPIRTNLPVQGKVQNHHIQHHLNLAAKSENTAQKYNQHAGSEQPELLRGMKVMLQEGKTWTPGTIVEKCNEPRSYVVQSPNGSTYRRNRRFIKELGPRTFQESNTFETPSVTPEVTADQPTTPRRITPQATADKQTAPRRVRFQTETDTRVRPPRVTRKPQRLIEET